MLTKEGHLLQALQSPISSLKEQYNSVKQYERENPPPLFQVHACRTWIQWECNQSSPTKLMHVQTHLSNFYLPHTFTFYDSMTREEQMMLDSYQFGTRMPSDCKYHPYIYIYSRGYFMWVVRDGIRMVYIS